MCYGQWGEQDRTPEKLGYIGLSKGRTDSDGNDKTNVTMVRSRSNNLWYIKYRDRDRERERERRESERDREIKREIYI